MLRNVKIRQKLMAIIIVPVVALTMLGTAQIAQAVSSAIEATRSERLTRFAVDVTSLIRELQRESALSAPYLGSGRGAAFRANMLAQRRYADRALTQYLASVRRLDLGAQDEQVRQTLTQAQAGLDQLGRQRQAIDAGRITLGRALAYYARVTGDLIAGNNRIATGSTDRELIRNATAFVAVSRAQQYAAQERDLIGGLLAAGVIGRDQVEQLTEIVGSERTWLTQFQQSATPEQLRVYEVVADSRYVKRANDLVRFALLGGTTAHSQVDPNTWYFLTTLKIDQLRQLELKLAGDVTTASRRTRAAATGRAVSSGATILLVLLLMVSASLAIAHSMAAPLRRLKGAAIEVAERKLPSAVDRLQRAEDPERLDLAAELQPIALRGRDEIGEVADAFNTVHQVAIRIATEQAALRRSIGDMFLNLARRSQRLVDRQIELIDDLEQEAEADELEDLFKLDHLATRMRRNAENLIVLSGAEPPRRWFEPVPLVELVRGAIAEVEDYQRIELLPMDDMGVVGYAVVDISHLLAELIDNATSYSPPGAPVVVAGQHVARGGYVVEVEDRGLGMSDEDLTEANRRLADPPAIDFAVSRRLGLFVVGRLAQRHGIRVQLRRSWSGGLTALVLLPSTMITYLGPDPAWPGTATLAPPKGQPLPPPGQLPVFEAARSEWFAVPRSDDGPAR